MKALYDNRIYNVADVAGDLILEGHDGQQFAVDFSDECLIVDPTDDEVADASNLPEYYGVNVERARHLRAMLHGEISIASWRALTER